MLELSNYPKSELLMPILETERLSLRALTPEDAPFILELFNDPDWLKYIGDRGIRTLQDAANYIVKGPIKMQAQHGVALHLVELKGQNIPIGMCGLIKRDTLEDIDLGYAFLPAYRGQGYAYEISRAVLAYGRETFGLQRVVAIIDPRNQRSAHLLEKLGFAYESTFPLGGDPNLVVALYALDLAPSND